MLGTAAFLALFLGSLLAGNFFGYYFHYKQDYYSAVGASGAVTGVLFSALLLYPNIELMLFLIPIPIPGYLFGIGYILYTLYGMKSQLFTALSECYLLLEPVYIRFIGNDQLAKQIQ